MQNEAGETVDLYVPRKCSATNRLITSNDKAAIQINVGHVNEDGHYTGEFTSLNICGFVRDLGESDEHVYRLWQEALDKHAGNI
eukprot:CAMPEP_0113873832 /NCGR_PEP_ID=MMETSP0780_2-20120614/3994_1 /TAXON_ID=652834 /ORGANISM="Palpitomonas bilix" /LENGTH=83 /DNA_ID=CAMNT_0000859531 /DNA_START=61 /DNA_END=312 /DNA_ORIENTATION=- /assembly_acc=CAM_ASM_000599